MSTLDDFGRNERDRDSMPWNDPRQIALAEENHRLLSRGKISENPLLAIPWATFPPIYAATKYIAQNPLIRPELRNAINQSGLTDEQATPPSWGQMGAAYGGMQEGLQDRVGNELRNMMQYQDRDEDVPWGELF